MRALLPVLTALLLLTTACGGEGDGAQLDAPIPVEQDGGIGDGAGLPPGDEPIPVEPDGGPGGELPPLDEAPPFGVSSEVASAVVEPSTYCWSPESGEGGMCADGFPQPERNVLQVDDQLVVTYVEGEMAFEVGPAFEAGEDGGGAFVPPDTSLPWELQAEGIWIVSTADLDPGEYALFLTWNGEQGDSSAAMTLRVG